MHFCRVLPNSYHLMINSNMQLFPVIFAKEFKSSLSFQILKKIITLSLLLQQYLPFLFNDKLHVARIATSLLGVLLRNPYTSCQMPSPG